MKWKLEIWSISVGDFGNFDKFDISDLEMRCKLENSVLTKKQKER